MASRIQPKEATVATTGVACLVAAVAWILINSIYVGNTDGWPQFVLSVFAAITVVGVGLATLSYAAHQQLVIKNSLFIDHEHSGKEFDYRSTGQWAVVTGATDGIGKEYARQLAADHGMDVLLVGRNPEKLRAVAALIRKETSGCERRVMTVVADFVEDPVVRHGECCCRAADAEQQEHDGWEQCEKEQQEDDGRGRDYPGHLQDDVGDRCFCDDRDGRPWSAVGGGCGHWYPRLRAVIEGRLQKTGGVGVLINCAGVCYPYPEYFAGMRGNRNGGVGDGAYAADFTADFCDNADAAVRCNVAAAVHACRLVLPGMLARGRGLVVNVGSASASVPPAAPLMALYAATKKFLEKLSADLDAECVYLSRRSVVENRSALGVRVQCVRPAYVATAMLRSANPDVREVPDSAECSDSEEECANDDDDDYGDRCWWTARRQRLENSVQRWLVPSARRWVRSALRQGGRLYASGHSGADGPASFTGYWPHTLLVWCATVANVVTPRRWFVDGVLMPGMLAYRAKGRETSERK